jgi:hypothetical protein
MINEKRIGNYVGERHQDPIRGTIPALSGGDEENNRALSEDTGAPSRDLNPGSYKYEASALHLRNVLFSTDCHM